MATEQDKNTAHQSKFQIVVFRLGDEEYAMSIDQIKEVVRTPVITKMPQTPSYICGVANVRGNIIAVVDLEAKFNLQSTSIGKVKSGAFTLVVESDEYKMGILVDEVPNTLAIAPADLDQTVTSHDGEQGYIKGIVKIAGRLIILIDIFKIMGARELQQAFHKTVAA